MAQAGKTCQTDLQRTLETTMISKNYHTIIQELYHKGTPKKAIARLLGIDIKTARRHLKQASWQPYERTRVSRLPSFPSRP